MEDIRIAFQVSSLLNFGIRPRHVLEYAPLASPLVRLERPLRNSTWAEDCCVAPVLKPSRTCVRSGFVLRGSLHSSGPSELCSGLLRELLNCCAYMPILKTGILKCNGYKHRSRKGIYVRGTTPNIFSISSSSSFFSSGVEG